MPFGPDGEEIILGDVIISESIIQYDLGWRLPEDFVIKNTLLVSLGRPNTEIRSHLAKLQTLRGLEALNNSLATYLTDIQKKPLLNADYPGVQHDKLFEANHRHTGSESCDAAECNADLISRERLQDTPVPAIHFGLIASGDSVIQSGEDRDSIAAKKNVIAFEMEGAGAWDAFPGVLVIKSAAGYADSHTNKKWQRYAAATAAACMKAFLKSWIPSTELSALKLPILTRSAIQTQARVWMVPFEVNLRFTGRESELEKLDKLFASSQRTTKVAITGLGGVGKTQLVLEFAYRYKHKTSCTVIWIPVTSKESLEKGYHHAAKSLNIPGYEDEKADMKGLVQAYLSREGASEWLLIFDNADDIKMWIDKPTPESKCLIDYLPKSPNGSIIFTVRYKKAAVQFAGPNVIDVLKMDDTSGKQLLQTSLINQDLLRNIDDVGTLLTQLTCLPLAIIQAASYINQNHISLAHYISLLGKQEESIIELLSEDFDDEYRYQEVKNPVATTWIISFDQMTSRNPLAIGYLSLMSCIDSKDIPQSFLPEASSEKKTTDALGTLQGYSFITVRYADSTTRTIDIHRLVHLATRNWLRMQNLLSIWANQAMQRLVTLFDGVDEDYNATGRFYVPHAYYSLQTFNAGYDGTTRLMLLSRYGHCLVREGRYPEAEPPLREVMESHMANFGLDSTATFRSIADFANILTRMGKLKQAEQLYLLVLEKAKLCLAQSTKLFK